MQLVKGKKVGKINSYKAYEIRNYDEEFDTVILKTENKNDWISAERDELVELRPLSDEFDIYDEVIVEDNNIGREFIVTDTYNRIGVLEIEPMYGSGMVLFVREEDIKKIW